MNSQKLLATIGDICDEFIDEAAPAERAKISIKIISWAAVAACFVLVTVIGLQQLVHLGPAVPDHTDPPISDTTGPIDQLEPDILKGIWVNGKLYYPEEVLTKEANENNVGAPVGYVSLDGESQTELIAYRYIPDDGKTDRIVIPYNNRYNVYSFYSFEHDGTEGWLRDRIKDAVCVQIRDTSYGYLNETVYLTLDGTEAMEDLLTFLSELDVCSLEEVHRRYIDRFEEVFGESGLSINENGFIDGPDREVRSKLTRFVSENERHITIIMSDHAELNLLYRPAAGTIQYIDFGYLLTPEQVKQVNRLIGLE